jgi:protein involved in polysaccharide export with SLBB domain
MSGNHTGNIALQPKDEIVIHSIDVVRLGPLFVEIFGSVKNPGRYRLTDNMTLVDVLLLANGFTEEASRLFAEIARIDETKKDDTLAYIKIASLPDITDTSLINTFAFYNEYRKTDFVLQHRDQIYIRPNPEFHIQKVVAITGEVNHPGQYALVTHNELLSDIITRSGGPTKAAYLRGGKIIRDGSRVNIDFQVVMDSPGSKKDLIIHSGDEIEIPKKPNSVRMAGEINNTGLLSFIEGDNMWDYIDRAGGITDSADFIILLHPNGNAERFRTGIFGGNPSVYDGSIIMVSKIPVPSTDEKQVDIGNLIRDMFAIAASALTVLVLSRQL